MNATKSTAMPQVVQLSNGNILGAHISVSGFTSRLRQKPARRMSTCGRLTVVAILADRAPGTGLLNIDRPKLGVFSIEGGPTTMLVDQSETVVHERIGGASLISRLPPTKTADGYRALSPPAAVSAGITTEKFRRWRAAATSSRGRRSTTAAIVTGFDGGSILRQDAVAFRLDASTSSSAPAAAA